MVIVSIPFSLSFCLLRAVEAETPIEEGAATKISRGECMKKKEGEEAMPERQKREAGIQQKQKTGNRSPRSLFAGSR